MLHVVIVVYAAVLFAELAADKTTYTAALLVTRYSPRSVYTGIAVAFAIKMGVAVAFGSLLSKLPSWIVGAMGASTFAWLAVTVWLNRPDDSRERDSPQHGFRASFMAILFSEWGDLGQLTAAACAAQFHRPWIVWFAATAALLSKGTLAATLGRILSTRVHPRYVRAFAACSALLFAIVSIVENVGGKR